MKVKRLINSFSLNMLSIWDTDLTVQVKPLTLDQAREILHENFTSFIGHADTAVVVGNLLCRHVPENRATLTMQEGEAVMVAQYRGPRLPEGATTLPEGAEILFMLVAIGRTPIRVYEGVDYDAEGMPWPQWECEWD